MDNLVQVAVVSTTLDGELVGAVGVWSDPAGIASEVEADGGHQVGPGRWVLDEDGLRTEYVITADERGGP